MRHRRAGQGHALALALLVGLVTRLIVAGLPMSPGTPALGVRRAAMECLRLGPIEAARRAPEEAPLLWGLAVWPIVRGYASGDPALVAWEGRSFGVCVALPAIAADLVLIVLLFWMASRLGDARWGARAAMVWALNPAAIIASAACGSPATLALALGAASVVLSLTGWVIPGLALAVCSVAASPWGILFACVTVVLATRPAGDSDAGALRRAAVGLALGAAILAAPLASRVPARELARIYTSPWLGTSSMTRHAFDLWYLVLGPGESDERVIATTDDLLELFAWMPVGEKDAGATPHAPRSSGPPAELKAHHVGMVIALFILAMMLMRAMGEESTQGAWDQVGPLLLLVLFTAPRVVPVLLVWPIPFLLVSGPWRRTGWLLTAIAAMNLLYVLGPWASWGAAAQGGWGAGMAGILAVVMVRSFVRSDLRVDGLATMEQPGTIARTVALVLAGAGAPEEIGGEVRDEGTPSPPARSLLDEPGPERWGIRDAGLILVLTVTSGLLRWHALPDPPVVIFDEVYHAKAGEEIFAGKSPNEWVHPPLAKLLIGLGERPFLTGKGEITSKGWRLAPWVAGTLVIPFLYWLGRAVLLDRRAVAVGVLLFATDGGYFVMSRTAMTNIFAVLFEVTAYLCVYRAIRAALRPLGPAGYGGWLSACGIALGLGISTRWTNVWVLGTCGGLYGLVIAAKFLSVESAESAVERLLSLPIALVLTALHLVVVPLAIYVLSYYPLVNWGCYATYHFVAYLQPLIFHFHTTFTTHHPYYSQWFTWCWDHRPVWYHYRDEDKTIYGIIAMGNPVLWCASVPAMLLGTCRAVKERDLGILFLAVAYASLYLPWGLSPRVFNYSHYYLESMPYASLVMGALMARAWDRREEGRGEALTLGVLSLAAFAFYYPLFSAMPISTSAYSHRILSKFWI